jgi:hypothetical protein
MYGYNLHLTGGIYLDIGLPAPVFEQWKARMLLRAYLPGFSLSPQYDDSEGEHGTPTLSIRFEHSRKKQLVQSAGEIVLRDRWSSEDPGSLLDFIHLLCSAARVLWLQRGMYCVHSACVGKDERYVLVVGHSGTGKTSIALNMAAERLFKVFSSNKTLISLTGSKMKAKAGTRTITTRGADAQRHLAGVTGIAYAGRWAFKLPDDMYASIDPVTIAAVALARINEGADNCSELSPESALHSLYPYFLDQVNADTVLCGGREVFCGTPPAGCQSRLSAALAKTLKRVPVYHVTGSVPFITKSLGGLA